MTRRQHPRRGFGRCQVELTVGFWSLSRHDSPAEYMKGRTVDLSEGGLLLRCGPFEDGILDDLVNDEARFAMRIHLSDELDWVRATAKVIWIEESGGELLIRACFVELDEESQNRINRVVARGTVEKSTLS